MENMYNNLQYIGNNECMRYIVTKSGLNQCN